MKIESFLSQWFEIILLPHIISFFGNSVVRFKMFKHQQYCYSIQKMFINKNINIRDHQVRLLNIITPTDQRKTRIMIPYFCSFNVHVSSKHPDDSDP